MLRSVAKQQCKGVENLGRRVTSGAARNKHTASVSRFRCKCSLGRLRRLGAPFQRKFAAEPRELRNKAGTGAHGTAQTHGRSCNLQLNESHVKGERAPCDGRRYFLCAWSCCARRRIMLPYSRTHRRATPRLQACGASVVTARGWKLGLSRNQTKESILACFPRSFPLPLRFFLRRPIIICTSTR